MIFNPVVSGEGNVSSELVSITGQSTGNPPLLCTVNTEYGFLPKSVSSNEQVEIPKGSIVSWYAGASSGYTITPASSRESLGIIEGYFAYRIIGDCQISGGGGMN